MSQQQYSVNKPIYSLKNVLAIDFNTISLSCNESSYNNIIQRKKFKTN